MAKTYDHQNFIIMLTHYLPKLKDNKWVQKINAYLYSPWYIATIVLLMVLSNLLSLEFAVMWSYLVLAIAITLFADDCYPIVPMFCCGYMLFSAGNNPAGDYGQNDFSSPQGIAQLVVICVLAVVCIITRFVFEVAVIRRNNKMHPILTTGYIVLGVGYVLSGIFSHYDYLRTVIFALVQIVSLCVTYFFFFYTVDWSKRKVSDGATLFTIVGIGMFLEVVGMYLKPDVLQKIMDETFTRKDLESGWGIYNNVGGMMAMLMPAPFYFAVTQKRGWRYVLLASLLMVGVVLSQSRGAIVCGSVAYIASAVFAFIYSPKSERKASIITFASVCVVVIVSFLVLYLNKDNITILTSMLQSGLDDSGRFEIYITGLKQFCEAPFFGNGFYCSEGLVFQYGQEFIPTEGYFLPPRYHNTVVQLLASCGVVGLLAYGFHRYQTIKLFIKNPAPHKTFLAMGLLAHALASLLDCHMFNMGPGLTYGVMLLFAEMLPNVGKRDGLYSTQLQTPTIA